MKYTYLIIMMLLFGTSASFAQIHNPVKWSVATKKTGKNEATIYIKANIQNGWRIYGLQVPDGGPVATSFTFKSSKEYSLIEKVVEPKPKTKYEEVFKMTVPYHSAEVVYQQKVKLNSSKATVVSGAVEFMTCDNERCLPPDEYNFTVTIK